MTIAFVANRGGANTKSAGVTLNGNPSANLAVNALVIVKAVSDNVSTSDGETNDHSLSDSVGNVWTKYKEYTNGQGSAGTGVTVSVWVFKLTVAINTTDTITLTTPSVTARAFSITEYSMDTTKLPQKDGETTGAVDGNVNGPNLSLSGLSSTHRLYEYVAGIEGPSGDGYTEPSGFTNSGSRATSGGADDSNIRVQGARKIATSTGESAQGVLTVARDWAGVLVGIIEVTSSVSVSIAQTLAPISQSVAVTSAVSSVVTRQNSLEGGTDTTTISAANSGGASGDAFNTVTIAGGNAFTFDNDHPAHGALGAKVVATAQNAYGEWSGFTVANDMYFRVYLYLTALPTGGALRFIHMRDGANQVGAVHITTAGKLQILDAAGASLALSSATIPLNTLFRVEAHFFFDATAGIAELKYWTAYDSAGSPDESLITTAVNTGAQITNARFGHGATAYTGTFWFDDAKLSDAGWIGPEIEAPTGGTTLVWDRSSKIDAGGFQNAVDIGATPLHPLGTAVAAMDVGGFHQTLNAGDLWRTANEGLTVKAHQRATAVHFSKFFAGRVWATSTGSPDGGGNLYLFRSDDSGSSWELITNQTGWGTEGGGDLHPRNVGRLILEDSGGRILLATQDGLKLSTNGGSTWTARALSGIVLTGIAIDPNNPNRVFVTSDTGQPGFRVIDNAFTGTAVVNTREISTTCYDVIAVNEGGTTAAYIAAATLGIRKYTTAGGITNINPGTLSAASIWSDIDAQRVGSATYIVLACSNPSSGTCVWRSLNGGTAWTDITQSGNITNNIGGTGVPWWYAVERSSLKLGAGGWDTGGVRIDPNNPEVCIIAGRGGLWRTQNLSAGTPIWHPSVRGIGAFGGQDITASPINASKIITGAVDWTTLITTDKYVSQPNAESPQGYGGRGIWITPAEKAFIFLGERDTNDGGVWSSTNPFAASPTWTSETWGANGRALGGAVGIDGASAEVVIAYEEGVGIRRKSGGGAWITVATIASGVNTDRVDFVWAANSQYVFMYHPGSGLWRSANYGVTWSQIWTTISNLPYTSYLVQDPNNEGTLYVSTSSAVTKFTNVLTTAGSPTNVSSGVNSTPGVLGIWNNNGSTELYMHRRVSGSASPALFFSDDGGTSWLDITTSEYRAIALFVIAMTVGIDGDVWLMTDGNSVFQGHLQVIEGAVSCVVAQTLPRITHAVSVTGSSGSATSTAIAQTLPKLTQSVTTIIDVAPNITVAIAQTLPKLRTANTVTVSTTLVSNAIAQTLPSMSQLIIVGIQTNVGAVNDQPVPTYVVRTKNLDGSGSFDAPHNNLEFSYTLNGPGAATWTMPMQATGVTRANFEPWQRELEIYRDGALVWGGIMDRIAAQTGIEETVRVSAVGHFERFMRKIIDATKTYTNIEQFDIAWDLIDYAQSKSGGSFGITRATVPNSGKKRDMTLKWWENRVLGEVLEDMANLAGGFDFEVTADKKWKTYYPHKGVNITANFVLGQNVQGINLDIDGGNIASDIYAVGQGDRDRTCIAVAFDATARTNYKRLESVVDFIDIRNMSTLQDKAQRELNMRKGARVQPQLSVQTNDPPWGTYSVGDTATVTADYGFLDTNLDHRIIAIVVHLSQAGNEAITVHFDEVISP